jgi:hypothetical protein
MKIFSLTIIATGVATGLAMAETVNFEDMKTGAAPGWGGCVPGLPLFKDDFVTPVKNF